MPGQPTQKQKKKSAKGRKRSSSVDIARNPIVARLSKHADNQMQYVNYVAQRLNGLYRPQEKNKKQPIVHEITSVGSSDGTTAEFANQTVITRSRKSSPSSQPNKPVSVNQKVSMKGRYKNPIVHAHPQPWKSSSSSRNPKSKPVQLVESHETECSNDSQEISHMEERSIRSTLRRGLSQKLQSAVSPVMGKKVSPLKSPVPDRSRDRSALQSPFKVAKMSHLPSGSRSPSPAPKRKEAEPKPPENASKPELKSSSMTKGYYSLSMQKQSPVRPTNQTLKIVVPTDTISREEYTQQRFQVRDFTDVSLPRRTNLEQEIDKWLELAEMRSSKSAKSGKSNYTAKSGKTRKSANNKSSRGKTNRIIGTASPTSFEPGATPSKFPIRTTKTPIVDKSPKASNKTQDNWFQNQDIMAQMSDWTSDSEEELGHDTYTPLKKSGKSKNQIVSYSFRKKVRSPNTDLAVTLGKRSTSPNSHSPKARQTASATRQTLQIKFEAVSPDGAAVEQENRQNMFECGCGKVYMYERGLQRHWGSKHKGKEPPGCKYPPNHKSPPQLLRAQKLESAVLTASSSRRPVRQSPTPEPHLPKHTDKLYHAVQTAYSNCPIASKEAKVREQMRQMSANLPFLYSMSSLEDNFVHFEAGFGGFARSFEIFRHKFKISEGEDPASPPFPETTDEKMLVSSSLAQMFLGSIQNWGQIAFALLDLEKRFVFLGGTPVLRKLYYTNLNTPLSITYVMAAYLISIKHLVSIRYYSELAACLTILRIYINENYTGLLSSQLDDGEFNAGPDVCETNYPETLPLFVPGFLKDGFAKFVLNSSKFRSASNLKLLGLAPPQYTQLVHSFRLFCLWMLELGFTKTSLSLAASSTASSALPNTAKPATSTPQKTQHNPNPTNTYHVPVEDSDDLSVPPISQMSFGHEPDPQTRIKAE